MGSFTRAEFDEPVGAFHDRKADGDGGRRLWVPRLPDRPVLVLGSAQAESSIDTDRTASMMIPVIRRRSGGGAVLVSAADLVWFDLLIDHDDPLWSHDVGTAFEWVGRACRRALSSLGHAPAMHHGPAVGPTWSREICFAGLGSGELTLGGSKVVGISQRRTRSHARFQVAVLRRWEPERYLELFDLGDVDRRLASAELADRAIGLDDDPAAIIDAVEAALP